MNPSCGTQRKNVEDIARFFASKVPKETNFSNIKSRKYFGSKTEHGQANDYTSTLRDTLLYNESLSSISTGDNKIDNASFNVESKISTKYEPSHHKRTSSNILKISKEMIRYAEVRSTPKVSVKLLPKFISEDEDENLLEGEDDDTSEKVSTCYKQNKTVENVKKKRIDDSYDSKFKDKLNSTDIEEIKIVIPENFNYGQLLCIDMLYNEIIKELETSKTENIHKKNRIVREYFSAITSKDFDVYGIIDQQFGPSIQKMCKHFFIQEVLIFTLIYLKDFFTDVKDQLLIACKTCMFYLHQNLIIIMFLIASKAIFPVNTDQYTLCMKKIQENEVWLNKNNYKKYITNNNKLTSRIVRNIASLLEKSTFEIEKNYISIVLNYIKNINKLKVEVIGDILYKSVICNDTYSSDEELSTIKQQNDIATVMETQNPIPPFLPDSQIKEMTLVLDLDETLVHYVEDSESAYIQIRPGAESFLEEITKYFEVVVFTAAMQDYADLVIDELDKQKKIACRLYRQHTMSVDNYYIKDLSKLGRNIEKIIIVDNVSQNFKLQQENGLNIKNFEGDEKDNELDELLEDLIELYNAQVPDVREYLPLIRERMKQRYASTKDNEENKEIVQNANHD